MSMKQNEPEKYIETSPFPSAEFRFFVFDPMDADFVCFRTAEERDAKVQDIITMYCDDGWDESVEQVCVGEISGKAQQVNVKHRPADEDIDEDGIDGEGDYWDSDWDKKCDYQIVPFPPRISQAAQDVIAERRRQVEVEGFTPERDDEYHVGELAAAAGCYALFSDLFPNEGQPPECWPWPAEWWKPKTYRYDLVRSAALSLAEIERFDRAAAKAGAV